MPKAWNKQEKALVKKALFAEGKKLFETYGIRKTTVDDIIRAAGISKGAFYLFYQSKEELYFDILESFEHEFRETMFGSICNPGKDKRESLRRFFRTACELMTTNPLYSRIRSSDFLYLKRKLPEKMLKKHIKNDLADTARHFEPWMEKGWMRRVDPDALNGLFLFFFYALMHRDDFEPVHFEATMELWIDMISTYLVPQEKKF